MVVRSVTAIKIHTEDWKPQTLLVKMTVNSNIKEDLS